MPELRTQPDVIRTIAYGWTAVGVVVPLFALVFAGAHFVFGQAVLNADTGQNLTDGQVLRLTALFVAVGLTFLVGAVVLRRFTEE